MVEAGLPPGVVNLVTSGGAEVGDAIVDSPDVPVISFTGSSVTGRRASSSNARSGLSSGRADAVRPDPSRLPEITPARRPGSCPSGPSSSNARSGLSSGRADASASKMADQMHDLDQIGLSAARRAARRAAREPPGGGRPVAFVHETHATAVFVH
jgi:Aldehyde dehydrogenase family